MRRLILLGTLALVVLTARSAPGQDRSSSPHGALKMECTTCHRSDGWTPVKISRSFNHDKLGFPLAGAHASAACRSCHQSLDFKGAANTCASCHKDTHRGELGADCSRCHTPRSFLDRSVMARAHQLTRFPLEGAHLTADCTSCHLPAAQGGQQFVARQTTCVSCHQADYASARNPDHSAGGFPRECAQCHSVTVWSRARFDHDASRFPLTGAHRAVQCIQCHTHNQFTGVRTDCVGCHQQDYNQASTPNHAQAQFPSDCSTCHTTAAWQPAPFDHGTTQFALTGAHKAATCADCHSDGVYRGKPTACVSCHQTDFNGAKTPDHRLSQFPTDCTPCHTTTAWQPATFDHAATQFPLTGAHRAATCTDCHGDGVYRGKPTTCVSCHQPDYNGTQDPNHTQAQFPTDCTPCHTTTAWTPATFNHGTTQFPLTGAHKTLTCNDCHADKVYNGKPTSCQSCHLQTFNQTTSPNHTQLGWPQTCITCHSGSSNTTAWDAGVTLPTQYHTMFSVTHEKAQGDCTQCHNTTNYSQSTCSNHHHPPTCTYLNQNTCRD